MSPRILIVEDESELVTILRDNLELEGYCVLCANTGEAAFELASREKPDLILLDIMLPKVSGYDVCRRVRADGMDLPIIMLTARNNAVDRIAGLDVGADDYIGKPFDIGELLARIRAQLRRREQAQRSVTAKPLILGDVTVDFNRREVKRRSEHVPLSVREFELLRYFSEHHGEVLSRERILSDLWGYSTESLTRTVDNFVVRLRKHIEDDPHSPHHLLTVHGVGYRFVL
jgi:DNA-binding response OmpR family regulator